MADNDDFELLLTVPTGNEGQTYIEPQDNQNNGELFVQGRIIS
jgi:hypothetical protein